MIWILLPAYNEEKALPPLVQRIDESLRAAGLGHRVVVVDDGSKDRTGRVAAELAAKYPIDVVTHRYNRGLGETARDGFEYVAEHAQPEDVVVRMDCDDTHDPSYILEMLRKLDAGWEAVIASRYQPGGGVVGLDAYRSFISRCANLLMKACFPMRGVWEYTCGFRAYRVALLQDALRIFGNQFIDLKGMGFTGTVEKIIKLKMMRARVTEIPFVLRYDRKPGQSKVVTSITTLGYLVLIAKYVVPWGETGRRWQRECAERAARVYQADGRLKTAMRASA